MKLVEGDFLEMFPGDGEFDAVVTLFFIDMADNVIDFLSNIHRLLKPGGIWINLGRTSLSFSLSFFLVFFLPHPDFCRDKLAARSCLTRLQH